MKHLTLLLLVATLPVIALGDAGDVDKLVESVRQEALKEAEYDEQRIERFLRDQQEQRALLADAMAQLAAANRRADELRDAYEAN